MDIQLSQLHNLVRTYQKIFPTQEPARPPQLKNGGDGEDRLTLSVEAQRVLETSKRFGGDDTDDGSK